MKLFLYDKFWDSFIKLPKGIQKKTTEFMSKFRTNSRSSAINLESITSFKDKQLRTARIDDKYRAIIHVSATDEIYHLLVVDNHDEAMRWAENKIFEWNRLTQVYQVYDMNEAHSLQIESANVVTTSIIGSISDNDLLKIGVPERLLESVKLIKDYDDLQRIERFIPEDLFEKIFAVLDGIDINYLIDEVEQGLVKTDNPVEQVHSPNNQQYFFEVKDDGIINEMLSGDFKKWKVYLHASQRKIVECNASGSVKVTGGAGTGKTVAALHRAKFLIENRLKPAEKQLFFTTFTKSLSQNLCDDIKLINIDPARIVITNIHNYATEAAVKLKLIDSNSRIIDFDGKYKDEVWDDFCEKYVTAFDPDVLKEEITDIILPNNLSDKDSYLRIVRTGKTQRLGRKERLLIWDLFEKYKEFKKTKKIYELSEIINMVSDYYTDIEEKPFSFVIADEIQDFAINELKLLRNIVAEKENDLFLVGDPLQKIYAKQTNFAKAGINIRGRKSYRLKVNYRTTEEIKKAAVSAISDAEFDNFEDEQESKKGYISLLKGQKPQYEIFQTRSDELSAIIKLIETYTSGNPDIHYSDICIAGRTKDDLNDLKLLLSKNQLPCDLISERNLSKNSIKLSTFHNIKGLEFKVVILTAVNERTYPYRYYGFENLSEHDKQLYVNREKALMYVAMSRAIKILHLTGSGNRSQLITL